MPKVLLIFYIIAFAAIVGWIMNVYKLVHLDFSSPYKAEAIRVVGLVPPIGAIVGYINIEDGKEKEDVNG